MKTEIATKEACGVKCNSLQAWVLAIRPRTLTASAMPVVMACCMSWLVYGQFRLVPAVICLIFALLAQVASNLANDYFDYKNGGDVPEARVGPARAVVSGWISPEAMSVVLAGVIVVACGVGMTLVWYGGWWMMIVGVVCVIGLLGYSAGPFPASRHALGDVMVVVFYGLVPVIVTTYLVSGVWPGLSQSGWLVIMVALAEGLASDNILVLNNYRDYDNDKAEGKLTLIVLAGKRFGEIIYLLNGIVALLLMVSVVMLFAGVTPMVFVLTGYMALHVATWRGIVRTRAGVGLNKYLGATSRNLVVLTLVAVVVLFCA